MVAELSVTVLAAKIYFTDYIYTSAAHAYWNANQPCLFFMKIARHFLLLPGLASFC